MRVGYKTFFLTLLTAVIFINGCSADADIKDLNPWDTTTPAVSSTIPADLTTDAAVNGSITATFSKEMNPLTITDETFIVTHDATAVTGTVSYSGVTAVFIPDGDLDSDTLYTATIAAAVSSLEAYALAAEHTWSFTTSAEADVTAPAVSSTMPADTATDAAVNSGITVTFSEGMNPATITNTTITVKQGTTPVAGVVRYAGTAATFDPAGNLAFSTEYTVTISTAVTDLAGNALPADTTFTFTTGVAPDITKPAVSFTIPANAAEIFAINGSILATFSEGMDPLTITNMTFILLKGTTPVAGTVTYSGVTAVFRPAGDLEGGTSYTAMISIDVRDLAGNALADIYTWTFTTAPIPDTTRPTVSFAIPANLTGNVAVNGNIAVTFSEGMNHLTITTATFNLMQETTPVTGMVSYSGLTAVFAPAVDLAYSTTYTATITAMASDLAGNTMAGDYVLTFTTGAAPDITAPTVNITFPSDAATGVVINGALTATFSEGMDPLTMTNENFTLARAGTPVAGTVAYYGVTATFYPTAELEYNTTYTVTVTTGAGDLAGNALDADYTWSFTTGAAPDTTKPTVNFTTPINAAGDVAVNENIMATFSEEMDSSTITTMTFTLRRGTTPVAGAVIYADTIAMFNPSDNLTGNTTYVATITTGARDLAGNELAFERTWSFMTETPSSGPPRVNLGTAVNFVILSKSGITVGAGTSITGNIGVSPIHATALVGFALVMDASGTFSTSALVSGHIYAADYKAPTKNTLKKAVDDMENAYNDAAGRLNAVNLGSGELGGRTIAPGLYKWNAAVTITTDVTLNGGPNDVWIIQINGALSMAAGTHVLLTGGALPKNIFWQTVGAVSMGANADLKGIVLSQAAITMGAGANVNGKLYALTANTEGAGSTVGP